MKRSLLLALLVSLAFAAPASAKCDDLDPAVCLQPFPNNYFTKSSTKTATPLNAHLPTPDMPRNAARKPLQPAQSHPNAPLPPRPPTPPHAPPLPPPHTHPAPTPPP